MLPLSPGSSAQIHGGRNVRTEAEAAADVSVNGRGIVSRSSRGSR
jgi:hypothetical protein